MLAPLLLAWSVALKVLPLWGFGLIVAVELGTIFIASGLIARGEAADKPDDE